MQKEELLRAALKDKSCYDEKGLAAMIRYAYEQGCYTKARELSAVITKMLNEIEGEANKSRYRKLIINTIFGTPKNPKHPEILKDKNGNNYIYDGDYAGDFGAIFGGDETGLSL